MRLRDPQRVLHIDDRRLATIFNEYFASVFTVKDISIIPEPSIRFEGEEENFFKNYLLYKRGCIDGT